MKSSVKKRLRKQWLGFFALRLSALGVFCLLGAVLFFIVRGGIGIISWEFLADLPKKAMSEGGILSAIAGTVCLGVGTIIVAIPIGVLSAVYLEEYAGDTEFKRWITIGINTLAGMPSIVYGLLGLLLFVNVLGLGISLISGILTLAVMSLPMIVSTSREALCAVPNSFREASYALGATRLSTVFRVVFPHAISGIITGAILALGRAVGETAPIMFTAAIFYSRKMPDGLFSPVMALPYHIYGLVTEGIFPDKQIPIAYGSALVLLCIVILLSGTGVYLRHMNRKQKKW